MPLCPLFGRYREESGHNSDILKPTRLTRNGHSSAFYALRGLAPLGTTADSWVIRTMMASTVLNQMPQSARARRQALLLITLMASVPQALNARLCVGANPYIGSRRVFDDR
jgi:hypothetical protein